MIQEVVDKFMAGKQDGVCPECGKFAEAVDSDEGPGGSHWFERYWRCEECGEEFTEKFQMVPTSISMGWR
ncbi:MAG: hypothetical protein IJ111_01320 [Eggerthellaceae bacterium]|nr:hypothetical protein [Eggerthellaceae bacterium]